MRIGIVATRIILERRKNDMETIGADNEHFQKGPIYEKRI